MSALAETAAAEERDLTETEQRTVAGWQSRCAEIDGQLETGQQQVDSARAFAGLMARAEASSEPVPQSRGGGVAVMERRAELTTPGRGFIESPAFLEYRGAGMGPRYEVDDFLSLRAPIMTSDLNIQPFRWTGPPQPPFATPLLDVVAHVSVSTGAIEWVIIGPDPEAAVVAEGAPKPEATLTFTPASAALETLAHWIQITRQALEDASYIQSLIETKLRRGLALKAEHDAAAAIVAGWPAVGAVTGTTLLEAIRVGIATVEDRGYRPNAVLMNPADWAALDIAVMVESVDGPARQQTFWGLRPVASSDVAAGTAYVGDFQSAVTLFDRGVSNVFLTDSHAANFISNVLVILAETRLKTVATELLAAVPVQAAP
jgi:hypothetical protein